MTSLQKKIFECLFQGGHIVKLTPGTHKNPDQLALFSVAPVESKESPRYSVRDKDFKLRHRIGIKSIPFIFKHCREVRKFKTTVYEINKQLVLKLNGNSWLKKRYKEIRQE